MRPILQTLRSTRMERSSGAAVGWVMRALNPFGMVFLRRGAEGRDDVDKDSSR